MLITIRVPDETTEIYYATKNEDGYSGTKSVTMGKRNQIVSIIQSTKKCIGCGRRFKTAESRSFRRVGEQND